MEPSVPIESDLPQVSNATDLVVVMKLTCQVFTCALLNCCKGELYSYRLII